MVRGSFCRCLSPIPPHPTSFTEPGCSSRQGPCLSASYIPFSGLPHSRHSIKLSWIPDKSSWFLTGGWASTAIQATRVNSRPTAAAELALPTLRAPTGIWTPWRAVREVPLTLCSWLNPHQCPRSSAAQTRLTHSLRMYQASTLSQGGQVLGREGLRRVSWSHKSPSGPQAVSIPRASRVAPATGKSCSRPLTSPFIPHTLPVRNWAPATLLYSLAPLLGSLPLSTWHDYFLHPCLFFSPQLWTLFRGSTGSWFTPSPPLTVTPTQRARWLHPSVSSQADSPTGTPCQAPVGPQIGVPGLADPSPITQWPRFTDSSIPIVHKLNPRLFHICSSCPLLEVAGRGEGVFLDAGSWRWTLLQRPIFFFLMS